MTNLVTTTCQFCGKEYQYNPSRIIVKEPGKKRGYNSSKYCCHKCAISANHKKQQQTLSEKYGNDISNPFHIPGVQDKVHETNMKKYGTKYGVCSEQSIKKRKQTCKEKYGTETPLQNKEIHRKSYESNLKNHDGTYYLATEECRKLSAEAHQTPEYREKARKMFDVEYRQKRCMEIFGVDNVFKLKEYQDKVRETWKQKFGVDNPAKDPQILQKRINSRLTREADNLENLNREFFLENFVVDNHFDLKKCSEYFNITLLAAESFKDQFDIDIPVIEIEDKSLEGEFYQFIASLTDKEIIRHDRVQIAPLELDIYIPEMQLAFEFNGDYWHSVNKGLPIQYHRHKSELCLEKGIRLIHIWENEWINDRQRIEVFIRSLFIRRAKIRASKCEIKEIPWKEFSEFAEKYHLLGSTSAQVKIGLYWGGELVSAIGLTYNKEKNYWDLKRYIVGEYQVMGGFEKMFKYFIETYHPEKIITFVELSKFTGAVNLRNGFKVDKELPPDFFWVVNGVRVDKWTAWRRFKTKNMNTREYQEFMMMFSLKCYDSGKRKLVWTNDNKS